MDPPKQMPPKPQPPSDVQVPFVASSAQRRRKHPLGPGAWAALVVAALIVLIFIVKGSGRSPASPPTPPLPQVATHAQQPTLVASFATPSPTSTPGSIEVASVPLIVTPLPSPTPSPLPTWTPRLHPTVAPTPSVVQCVAAAWTARQGELPFNQILIDIDATNRCGRTLGRLDLWFTISGWRNGSLVQSIRGHPFDSIDDGETGSLTIALPGSIDWYDRITVQVSGTQGRTLSNGQ